MIQISLSPTQLDDLLINKKITITVNLELSEIPTTEEIHKKAKKEFFKQIKQSEVDKAGSKN